VSNPYDWLDAPPFVPSSETSRAAAESVKGSAAGFRAIVLGAIRGAGAVGYTCDELEAYLSLTHQTCSARVRELVLRGDVLDSGKTRKTRSGRAATVWIAPGPVGTQGSLL
jgi:hypothetical protein